MTVASLMNLAHANPNDFLLAGIFTGYLLAATLTWMVLKLYGLKGLPLGILSNVVVHVTLLMCTELASRGRLPDSGGLIKTVVIFTFINLVFTLGAYFVLRSKGRHPELTTALGLFISSIFIWDFFIPAIFALIVLLIPEKETPV